MSNREKILIYILLLVCILGGGFKFLTLPMIDEYTNNLALEQELSGRRSEISMQIQKKEEVQEIYTSNQEELSVKQSMIGTYRREDEIESQLRQQSQENQVTIVDIVIGIDAYQYLDTDIMNLTAKTAEINMYGSIEGILSFIDEVNQEDDSVITNVSIDITDSAVATYESLYNVDTQGVYKVSMVYFMEANVENITEE